MSHTVGPKQKKQRMPTGMYVGSAILGFGFLGILSFTIAFLRATTLVNQGEGNVVNYTLILVFMAIFMVGLPLYFGIRILKRAGQQAHHQAEQE